jgi:hypothetical protein
MKPPEIVIRPLLTSILRVRQTSQQGADEHRGWAFAARAAHMGDAHAQARSKQAQTYRKKHSTKSIEPSYNAIQRALAIMLWLIVQNR